MTLPPSPPPDPIYGLTSAHNTQLPVHIPVTIRYRVLLRWIIPTVLVILIATGMIWSFWRQSFTYTPKIVSQQAAKNLQSIENPLFRGFDKNDRPYSITASLVEGALFEGRNDIEGILLYNPEADLFLNDASAVQIKATSAYLKNNSRYLIMEGDIEVTHDQGHVFRTNDLIIDLHEGTGSSDSPIEASGILGIVSANGIRFDIHGNVIHFMGKTNISIPIDPVHSPLSIP